MLIKEGPPVRRNAPAPAPRPAQRIKLSELYSSFIKGAQDAGYTVVNDMQRPAAPAPAAAPAKPAPRLSAWQQIEALARARAKADHITFEQAVVRVVEDDPTLYARYQAEPAPAVQQAATPAPAQPGIWIVIDQMATARAAATPGLTYAAAVGLICEENPNLYAAYQRENRA